MELKKATMDASMPKKNSPKAVFACAAVLAAGLMGCISSEPPPRRTMTICESYGMPPRGMLWEGPRGPYSQSDIERQVMLPYTYINCVTIVER
ncbi:hypothetical protein H0O00_00365 [Candidatus Micrarchaeota archaeon]|nr:hypothetical protein [Candidatus Micrarchaeota archaeon]